jgi:hypothetical protein
MYKLKVNNKYDFDIDNKGEELLMNDTKIQADIRQLSQNTWHII